MKRGKPLRSFSPKRQAERARRAEVRAEVLARDGGCQGRALPGRCWHPVDEPLDVHEIISRARWAKGYLDPDNCLALCRAHHDWVETHPTQAEALGFSAKAPQPGLTKGEGGGTIRP